MSWGLIFATTKIFHFSHALTLTVAVYAAVVAVSAWGLALPLGFGVAAAVGCVVGVGTELLLYRPLRRVQATQLNIFLASLGLLIAGQSAVLVAFGPQARALEGFPMRGIELGPVAFTTIEARTLARIAKNTKAFTTQVFPNRRPNVTKLRVSSRRKATPSTKKCGLNRRIDVCVARAAPATAVAAKSRTSPRARR